MGLLMTKIDEKYPGPPGKTSLAITSVFGILWFTSFIIASIKLGDPTNSSTFRMWLESGSNLKFPSWVVCPHRHGYNLAMTSCAVLSYQTRVPVTVVSGTTVQTAWGTQCTEFNYDGSLQLDRNYFLQCDVQTSNGIDSQAPVKYYFVDQDGTNFTSCASCIGSSDFFVLAPNHSAYLGLELVNYQEGPTVEPNAIITTPKAPNGIPASSYRVGGQSLYDNTLVNISRVMMTYNTQTVVHWERSHPYDFWFWLTTMGGTAYLFKLLHDFIMFVLGLTLFRHHQAAQGEQYAQIK